MRTREELNDLGSEIIGAAIDVHKNTGPGLLEEVYEHCLMQELKARRLRAVSQLKLPVIYKGVTLEKYYNIDILVEDEIILELKSVQQLHPIHEVQLVTYMRLADKRLGYLMNFNVSQMIKGIKRKVNGF